MLEISISKSFDRPFVWRHFLVAFGVVSLEKMELGTRFKDVFCGGDLFRHAGNLSIYRLETQRIAEITGCSATVSESSD